MMRRGMTYASQALWRLGLRQWAKHAPFYQLRDALIDWNQQRLQRCGSKAALNAQDIMALRQVLEQAHQQSPAALPATLLDQWFFLAVGAIQVHAQTGSTRAWQLFEQSVHSQLGGYQHQRAWSFGLLVTVCVIWMSLSTGQQKPVAEEVSPLTTSASQSGGGTADPVTLSLLNLAYQKMQSGSCQLPQAAMLPEAQRQAFVVFVTEGKVDVDQVEHLRQALGYVSCLYPQELMRPQGRDRLPRE